MNAGVAVVGRQPRLARGTSPVKALGQLAAAGVTGALTVVGEPGGVVFLREGRVTGVESPAAPSVDRLLTACGRVEEQVWETIPSLPARALVEGGHVTAAELELCAVQALYDAAFFVLSTKGADLRFDAGIEHWLGAENTVTADQLCDHVVRQRRMIDEVHPSEATDLAPVVPVLRPGLDRVLLSGLQWEIVLHADGRRTPQDLAGLLGRSAYAVTLDVRRLAAAGLVTAPAVAQAPEDPEAVVAPGEPELPKRVPGTYTFDDPPAQRRRELPAGVSALAVLPGAIDRSPDDSLLKRIRSALQSLR
ncbi:ADAM 12 protein [Dactylosporangium sp. AC04546]|uniref:ADAM 12 protein n=1 Tax=Dactylosporangium sp. AC04546 TaxID=2862460 RepID=UPI001EE1491B|nr:ADAM 12 protein [Dactylosporangium sp. AC04546]WVK82522.1 ADAM 12 protein [Dactylosporangium sp. AC04546]